MVFGKYKFTVYNKNTERITCAITDDNRYRYIYVRCVFPNTKFIKKLIIHIRLIIIIDKNIIKNPTILFVVFFIIFCLKNKVLKLKLLLLKYCPHKIAIL